MTFSQRTGTRVGRSTEAIQKRARSLASMHESNGVEFLAAHHVRMSTPHLQPSHLNDQGRNAPYFRPRALSRLDEARRSDIYQLRPLKRLRESGTQPQTVDSSMLSGRGRGSTRLWGFSMAEGELCVNLIDSA